MQKLKLLAILLPLTLVIGCQSLFLPSAREWDKGMDEALGDPSKWKPVPPPNVQTNPAARNAYVLTLRFADAPGPIAEITAFTHYQVENHNCIPTDYTRAPGGIRLLPDHYMPLKLQRVDDITYTATLFEDALLHENYYGLGVCRWVLNTAAVVNFQSAATRFIGALGAAELHAEQARVQHYLARDFTQKPPIGDAVFGETAGHYLAAMGPQFTLTITARKASK